MPQVLAKADPRLDLGEPAQPTDSVGWASITWRNTLALIGVVTVIRLVYLIWLNPYELVGDEAYYWEQARHLSLGYVEKGPILAWMIAACCAMFGDHEWSVRLPVLVAFTISAWLVGRLAMTVTRGDAHVAFVAVATFCLLPAFQANAQICTQDGPFITVWLALTVIGLRLIRRWHAGRNTWLDWMSLWFVLGIGVLLKQSILLFLPSLALYALLQRRALAWRWTMLLQQVAGVALLLLVVSPMLLWNARHGWPMLAHTLGHLGAGGDQAGQTAKGNPAKWLFATIGGIVGAVGPAALLLMIWASVRIARCRLRSDDAPSCRDRLWLSCATWPAILFFVALSFTKAVVPSWPLPHFAPMVVPLAEMVVLDMPVWRGLVDRWKARGAPGWRRPETPIHQAWHALIAYGVLGWMVLSFPTALAHLPLVGAPIERTVVRRIQGHRATADRLAALLTNATQPGKAPPLLVLPHYMDASLAAFYLPGHPVVFNAQHFMGGRLTNFNEWADTDLTDPALHGRDLLLDSADPIPWERVFVVHDIVPLGPGLSYLAHDYQGVRPDHP